MPDELIDKKLTQFQADQLMAPMELDLWALFRFMEEDMLTTVEKFQGTPEQMIQKLTGTLTKSRGDKMPIQKELVNKVALLNISTVLKAALPVGTKRERKDGTYQKQPDEKEN